MKDKKGLESDAEEESELQVDMEMKKLKIEEHLATLECTQPYRECMMDAVKLYIDNPLKTCTLNTSQERELKLTKVCEIKQSIV